MLRQQTLHRSWRPKWAFPLAAILLSLALAAGCDDGPSNPEESTLFFEGTVATGGESFHVVNLTKASTLRIELTRLSPLLLDVTFFDPVLLSISIGLGRPGEAACNETTQFTLIEGGQLFFGLNPSEYCVSVFDGGQLPPETLLAYSLKVEIDE